MSQKFRKKAWKLFKKIIYQFHISFSYPPPDSIEHWRLVNLYFNMAGVLFEDIFDVKDIDPEGKKFDRGKLCSGYRSFYRLSVF